MSITNATVERAGTAVTGEGMQPYLNRKRLSDEGLVMLFAENNDEEAFNEIVNRYRERIYWTTLKMTNNTSDTEDVVQEIFLAVYKKAKTFRGDSKFSTWLYRLTMNEVITKLRQRKRERQVFLSDYLPQFEEDGHHTVRPVVDWSQEVDKIVAEKEFHRIIQQTIDQLSPLDRAVVVLSEIEEMSNPEIGKALGLSVQAVKARLHRARLFLRGKLAVHLGYSPA